MRGMPGLDSEQIRHAILTAKTKGYRQVRIRLGEDRFSAVLSPSISQEVEEDDEPVLPFAAVASELAVSSPAVGYFRAVVELRVGDKLAPGDKVGEVVALGIANDVTAQESGEVAEVFVADGDPVEFGQKIALLRP